MPKVTSATAHRRRRIFVRKASSKAVEPTNSTNFPLLSFSIIILLQNAYAVLFALESIETQEFKAQPMPHWPFCFSDTIKGPKHNIDDAWALFKDFGQRFNDLFDPFVRRQQAKDKQDRFSLYTKLIFRFELICLLRFVQPSLALLRLAAQRHSCPLWREA
jgi:hypothetical protein